MAGRARDFCEDARHRRWRRRPRSGNRKGLRAKDLGPARRNRAGHRDHRRGAGPDRSGSRPGGRGRCCGQCRRRRTLGLDLPAVPRARTRRNGAALGLLLGSGRRALLRRGGRRRHVTAPGRGQMRAGLGRSGGPDGHGEPHSGRRQPKLRRSHDGHGNSRLAFDGGQHRPHPHLDPDAGLSPGRHDPARHRPGRLQGHRRQIDAAFLCRVRPCRIADRVYRLPGRDSA